MQTHQKLDTHPSDPVNSRLSLATFSPSRALGLSAVLLAVVAALPACNSKSTSQAASAAPGAGAPPAQDVTVLLLGDDLTRSNGMPALLRSLSLAAGRSIVPSFNAPTGSTLGSPQASGNPHSSDPVSLNLINSQSWDYVVLQEEGTTPTIPFAKDNFMVPAANTLSAVIQANDPNTRILLFETWGHDAGGQFCVPQACSPTFLDFDSMQDTVSTAYMEVATAIGADLAPVGSAFQFARQRNPAVALHEADGFTPTLAGSYLTACVIYTQIYQSSPVGIPFTGGLPQVTAAFLQDAAANSIWGPTCGLSIFGDTTAPQNSLFLTATGGAGPGGVVALTPGNLPPSSQRSFIYTSFSDAFVSLPRGVLLVDLTQQIIPRKSVRAGESWTITIPNDPTFTGLEIFFQVLLEDPLPPGGTLFSPGVRLQICP